MKKIILILVVSMFVFSNNANAQLGNALNQLEKTGEKLLADTKKAKANKSMKTHFRTLDYM